ncbi:MAG: serine--tRNA ligase [Candidatus Pelagibacterales bacterium]|nr:MAG: serine--tRNA ligase [Pelagibacterales bacterium]|tara:strand:+ start:559 stop:1818 length:1260 start_codon:yes stop_codon:yes gene_type:complete
MLDLKEIRKKLDFFKKKLSSRNNLYDLDELINLDKINRELIQKKEFLEQEKKTISKSKDTKNFEKSKELTKDIIEINDKQLVIQKKINSIISNIPNIPLDDVPVGKDENFNVEILKFGNISNFDFKPKSHTQLGESLNMLDFDLATKTTGSRFVFVKGKLALLERAITNFMLDTHVNINGYQEVSPPLLASENTMYGTGQLPKFENDQYEILLDDKISKDRKFLIPTAEVILTNMVKDKIINRKDLPIRLVAATPCFRKEAGSYGKDTKGMIRQHQFYKVEMVSIVEPQECINELNRMTNCATKILELLKLPYRKIILCTGDMGFSAEKTFDIEVWIPSENKYREISSCSSCGSFQARRMKARYKNDKNETRNVGTLNGSGLAVGRTLIAIMENYQQKDGSILIPNILKPYMGNVDIIN